MGNAFLDNNRKNTRRNDHAHSERIETVIACRLFGLLAATVMPLSASAQDEVPPQTEAPVVAEELPVGGKIALKFPIPDGMEDADLGARKVICGGKQGL